MNYEFKGTKGEWNVDGYDTVSVIAKVNEVGWMHVCKCDYGYASPLEHLELNKANAHLIAAAPELLQACIDVENTLRTMTNNPVSDLLMTRLQQAIHKALNLPTP